ncbi:Ig-like domain-containing protein, partial [Rubripirellula sp.]
NPVNDAPTLDSIDNLTIDEDAAAQTVNLAGITAGADEVQALKVTATSDNTDLISDPSVTYTSGDSTGSLSFTPVANQSGNATITVTVEDAGLDNDFATTADNEGFTRTFVVISKAINDPPTLDALDDLEIDEDAPLQTIQLAGVSAGPLETQTLRVTATSDNTDVIPDPSVTYTSGESTGSLSFTPVANQSGTATITVTVEDAGLDNDFATTADNENFVRTFVVVDKAVNDPPTLDPLDDFEIDEDAPLQTVQLAGISSGPLESESLRITATSGNTDVVPDPTVTYASGDSTGSLSFTPVANQSGTATITVRVEDAGPDNDFATTADNEDFVRTFVVVDKAVNDPPTLDPLDDLELDEDAPLQTIQLLGISSGPLESESLRITATSDNTALIPQPTVTYTSAESTGSLSFTPLPDQSGTATITVIVEDAGLDNDFATTSDNRQSGQDFVVSINMSTFVSDPGVITLELRGEQQTLAVASESNGMSMSLGDGLWYGVEVDDIAGNNSPTLILPPSKLSDRIEIVTTSDQSFDLPSASQWVLGNWDPIASPDFRPMVLGFDSQVVLHVSGQKPWKNFIRQHDITNDGNTSVLDALTIINELSRGSFVDLDTNQLRSPSELSEWPGIYYDTNGDDRGTVLDALLVINELARTSNSSGEGELTDVAIEEWSRDLAPLSRSSEIPEEITPKLSSKLQPNLVSTSVETQVARMRSVDTEFDALGRESLETLDESLISLLAE